MVATERNEISDAMLVDQVGLFLCFPIVASWFGLIQISRSLFLPPLFIFLALCAQNQKV
jgi:hypothetical protein